MNKVEDALEILAEIPTKYPDNELAATAYYNLGDFYYKSRQLENARFAFNNVLNHPRTPESLKMSALDYLIKSYYEGGLFDRAIALVREYLEKYPDADDAFNKRVSLGIFLKNLREYERAISYLRELKPKADNDTAAEIQYYIGECYEEMGQFEDAIIEYMKVKYLSAPTEMPWAVTAMYNSGMIYMKMNQLERAKQIFQRVVRERGGDSEFGRVARQRIDEIDTKLASIK
jgi:tetratricopeptide (TPR) repeat protein